MADQGITRGLVPRVHQLDGLRGLAAVTVVLLHLSLAFRAHRVASWFLLPFFTGSQAVILFFVLSGYVLSLPFWAGKRLPYLGYALSRVARIYIPFFVAAVLSIAGAYAFRNHPLFLTGWFNETWHTPVTWANVVAQFLMWPVPIFNTALWSLRYELQVSLLLPALFWLSRKTNVLILTALSLALTLHDTVGFAQVFGWHQINRTLTIAGLFLLGASAARYHHVIEQTLRNNAVGRWLVFVVSFYLYSVSLALPPVDSNWAPCAAASLGLILIAISSRNAGALLSSRLCTYFGRISYSLYLTHSIILFGLTYLLHGRIPTTALVALILLLSTAFAHLFHHLVEVPSIRLSARLRSVGASR